MIISSKVCFMCIVMLLLGIFPGMLREAKSRLHLNFVRKVLGLYVCFQDQRFKSLSPSTKRAPNGVGEFVSHHMLLCS